MQARMAAPGPRRVCDNAVSAVIGENKKKKKQGRKTAATVRLGVRAKWREAGTARTSRLEIEQHEQVRTALPRQVSYPSFQTKVLRRCT